VCRFKLSRNRLTVQVNLYDGIDFVCPFYDNTTDIVSNSSSDLQYYVIYMVCYSLHLTSIFITFF